MPAFTGEAFQLACRISEGVRQRILCEAEKLRVQAGEEAASVAMIQEVVDGMELGVFENDYELLFHSE